MCIIYIDNEREDYGVCGDEVIVICVEFKRMVGFLVFFWCVLIGELFGVSDDDVDLEGF